MSAPESRYTFDGASTSGLLKRARRSIAARRESRQARAPAVKDVRKRGTVQTKDVLDTKFKATNDDADSGLAAPVVTASALSVVVPAVGVAVLYERALLPAGAEHRVDISAREPLISRD
jgi:hypothetical protein